MSRCIGVGLRKRASVPALVFGKAMTSRIEDALHRVATRRSKPKDDETARIKSCGEHKKYGPHSPSAIPPCGGAPQLKA